MSQSTSAWTPPLAPADAPVYHYTTAVGLIGIMTNRELWATEASGLNDISEFRDGLTYLGTWMRETGGPMTGRILSMLKEDGYWAPSRPSEVFVLSATLDRDDAAQWRLYGGRQAGYAVELDPAVPLGVISGDSSEPKESRFSMFNLGGESTVAPWCRVAYTTASKNKMLQSLLDWARDDDRAFRVRSRSMKRRGASEDFISDEAFLADERLKTAIGTAAALIKPEGFRSEREVRAVASVGVPQLHTRFRATEYGIVRYLRLAAGEGSNVVVKDTQVDGRPKRRLPAQGVVVGPTPYFEQGRDTVVELCKVGGIDEPRVEHSIVPLRV
ncbi:DUF2971 domain-containing protein [Cellulomonas taurus]|uniref:DUF2971 domain-containing protein n=1 Tax=Cellulomonas taurus TaxID=2729175 RepID=UPI00145CF5E7|nr:DUF2971 domain-containing protein [Cellulomonas taurus]